jgi:signal transduction histidine kinase
LKPTPAPGASIAECGMACKTIHKHQQQSGLSDQVFTFFTELFNTNDWPPRWYCGTWSDFHGWLYIASDLLTWAAYFLIPVLLVRMIIKRKDFPFPKIAWLFVAFIVLCGTTHFIDAIIFWWPLYRLSALIRFLTAVVSMVTVYALHKILPNVLQLRSVKELEHEIRERRLVEEKLAASEFLLSEAGHVGRVGGWEFDNVSRRFEWSKTAYEILGSEAGRIDEMDDTVSLFVEPHREIMKQSLTNAFEKGIGWDLELQMITCKNQKKWVRYYGKPLFDQHGKLIKIRGVLMDIDKYKINELDLSKSVDTMARQNNQLKNFTHILSHNLRNHANNISLLSNFMDETTLDNNNSEIFQKIRTVSGGLNSTLDDLSSILKIRDGYLPSENLSFKEVTKKTLKVLEVALNASDATVGMHFEFDTILFPSVYLESIIMNLMSNGIKYKQADIPLHVTLKTYLNEDQIKIFEYSDNGIGIDLDLHGEKIFGLYKTFHSHKDAHGVGLFLIKNQIESQGGKIEVTSKPNQGTTFKITFNEKN